MNKSKKLILIGVFVALSIILQRISFPIIPIAPYLKLEFSSIPIIVIAIVINLKYAILATFIVNSLDFFINGSLTGLPIDQSVNVIAIILFMMCMHYFLSCNKKLLSVVVPVLTNVVILTLLNYVFITPLYFSILKIPLPNQFLIWTVNVYGVFNLIKWGLISGSYMLIHKSYIKLIFSHAELKSGINKIKKY